MKKYATKKLESWVEIDRSALISNVRVIKKFLKENTKLLAVVKGNAYGHGVLGTARIFQSAGVSYFGVFSFTEALILRRGGVTKPILVLEPARIEWVMDAIKYNIELSVADVDFLKKIEKLKLSKKARIHLNVETGLGRDGILFKEVKNVTALVVGAKSFAVVGLMTHLSGAESRRFDEYTENQYKKLLVWEESLGQVGIYPVVHIASTAGAFISPKYNLDMCRFGIGLYGLWSSKETEKLGMRIHMKLTPALSWKTRIVELKTLPKGHPIGYDRSYILPRASKIAICPTGYYDGIPRNLSNNGFVLVLGKRVPIVGRVMMNMIALDVSRISRVAVGDVVTILGTDGKETITAEEIAAQAGTINYEIVTRINPLVPRVYL